jgi:uncharacterized protein (TIGR00369 family)
MSVAETAASTDLSPLTGLEMFKRVLAGGRLAPIGETLGFRLAEVEFGRVVFEGEPTAAVYNPMGTVHGGYTATLLDSACACAVHTTLPAGSGPTTLELKVSFHKAMTDRTGTVRAEGRVVSGGRRAAFAEARLTDAEGRLYATATSSLLILTPGAGGA